MNRAMIGRDVVVEWYRRDPAHGQYRVLAIKRLAGRVGDVRVQLQEPDGAAFWSTSGEMRAVRPAVAVQEGASS